MDLHRTRKMKLHLTHPSIGTFAIELQSGADLILGRDTAEADLEMPWDPRVSRRHARIWIEDGRCWLEDLGSKNGSWTRNGRQLAGREGLDSGTQVLVGDTLIEVVGGDSSELWADVTESEDLTKLPEVLLDLQRSLGPPRDPAPQTPAEVPEDQRPTVQFTGPDRIRVEGPGLQHLWATELVHGRLFVGGPVSVRRGARVLIDINVPEGFFQLSGQVVHVGPGPDGRLGAGLAITSLPDPLRQALEEGQDETSATTIEIEAPIELRAEAETLPEPRAEPTGEGLAADALNAQRFVGLVAVDRLYEALNLSPEATDGEVQRAIAQWASLVTDDDRAPPHEDLRDALGRTVAMVEAQLGESQQRLQYDFARGHIFPEHRKALAECGDGPPLTMLASTWRRAFPARSERARRLWAASQHAAAAGRVEEARQLRAQARSLAPFQH